MSHDQSGGRGLSRRGFLLAAGGAAAAALPALEGEARAVPAVPAEARVPRRRLGKTNREIPILLMGGAMRFDPQFDPKLAECLRHGVDYFDTADCYAGGTSETAIGRFLARSGKRAEVWITTKSDRWDPRGLGETLEVSLRKLGTDHVEMLLLHQLDDPGALTAELARTAERLKKEGRIQAFGFSCHSGNVAELLRKAAGLSWIDAVMFRYSFRQYGDRELNAAMDACVKSDVGLIAMKTQASEAGVADAWKKFERTGRWNKFQAVLKATWADPRLAAAVSHMDSFEKLKENVAAALDRGELGAAERDSLLRYAAATRSLACDGCDHLCNPAVEAPVQIGATLRFLMYHEVYGDPEEARRRFRALPEEAQRIAGLDFAAASRACPHGVEVARHMERAGRLFLAGARRGATRGPA